MNRYSEVMERVAAAERRAGRPAGSTVVVAVSKDKTVEEILKVYEMGHRDFGENRAHELAEKTSRLPRDIRWHFVGALQSNKTRMVRPAVSLLHSMDRLSLARAWVKGPGLPPPVLIQVNVGGEPQKGGADPAQVITLLESILAMGIRVGGVMGIPPLGVDPGPYFRELLRIGAEVSEMSAEPGVVSMGMSDDFEIAIEEGSSMIRVGRAIFGPRE